MAYANENMLFIENKNVKREKQKEKKKSMQRRSSLPQGLKIVSAKYFNYF